MRRLDVQIPAADGHSHGTLHVPDGDGPWPGVLVFPDAGGTRETFGRMGDRLAGMGYVALIPDIYYRAGRWAPFDAATLFTDSQERARLGTLVSVLTNDRVIADAGAYADFLLARPEVRGSAIGTTGYCLGGRMSLIAAGGLGRKVAAAASFHGGRPGCWKARAWRSITSEWSMPQTSPEAPIRRLSSARARPGPNPTSRSRSAGPASSSETTHLLRRRLEERWAITQPATWPAVPRG
jgi:dienelactone hydrolase